MRFGRGMPPLLAALVVAGGLSGGTSESVAQEAQVRISEGPHYVGVPIDVQLVAVGFEEEPRPEPRVETPAGAELTLESVSPNVSTNIQIVNGKMSRTKTVRYVYRFQLLAHSPGELTVPSFELVQGSMRAVAVGFRIKVNALEQSDSQRFVLILPDRPVWIGERVPIKLQWWLTESVAERLAGRRAEVPLFDQVDRFKFDDRGLGPGAGQGQNSLVVQTANGSLELPATLTREQWQGKPYLVLTAQRTMIPLKAGTVDVPPASMVVEEAIRWERDFFGTRRPAKVRRVAVKDQARTLDIKPPPAQGRPASFAGAVGQGFSIDVSADRSVVQTGDPIRLTIDVRGDAALQTVSLPDLSDSGLDQNAFSLPAVSPAGSIADGVKRFQVVVRVNDDGVREIPGLEFSWFDPVLERYESTQSRPVALSVRVAKVVSAGDVVRSQVGDGEKNDDQDQATASSPASASAAAPTDPGGASRPLFTTSGAELSVETNQTVLRANPQPWYARFPVVVVLYCIGALAIVAGWALRQRAMADPVKRDRRKSLQAARRALASADGAGDVARALRRMAAVATPVPRDPFDALLSECDNLSYAPASRGQGGLDQRLRERALAIADRMVEAQR